MLLTKTTFGYALALSALLNAGETTASTSRVRKSLFRGDDKATAPNISRYYGKRSPNLSPPSPSSEVDDYILVSIPIVALETIPAPIATFLNLPLQTIVISDEADPNRATTVVQLSPPMVTVTKTVKTTLVAVPSRSQNSTSEAKVSVAATQTALASTSPSASPPNLPADRTTRSPTSSSSIEAGTLITRSFSTRELASTLSTTSQRSPTSTSTSSSSMSTSSASSPSPISKTTFSSSSSSVSSPPSSSKSSTASATATEASDVSAAAPPADDASMRSVPSLCYIGAILLITHFLIL